MSKSKIISLVVVLAYFLAVFLAPYRLALNRFTSSLLSVLGLCCIWFPDGLSDRINEKIWMVIPSGGIWFFGWVVISVKVIFMPFRLVKAISQ